MRTLLPALIVMALGLLASACGDRASTYDPEQGRFRSTEDMRQERQARDADLERRLEELEKAERK